MSSGFAFNMLDTVVVSPQASLSTISNAMNAHGGLPPSSYDTNLGNISLSNDSDSIADMYTRAAVYGNFVYLQKAVDDYRVWEKENGCGSPNVICGTVPDFTGGKGGLKLLTKKSFWKGLGNIFKKSSKNVNNQAKAIRGQVKDPSFKDGLKDKTIMPILYGKKEIPTKLLKPSQLGLNASDFKHFGVTYGMDQNKMIVAFNDIAGEVKDPFKLVNATIKFAKSNGAKSLQIQGNVIGHSKLLNIVKNRYGATQVQKTPAYGSWVIDILL